MSTATQMLTPREAARLLGVSYPTIKQWILSGKLKTVVHQVFPLAEAAAAHALMESSQHVGKIMLEVR